MTDLDDKIKAYWDRPEQKDLLVVPGDGFGCPGYLRLSYCVSNEMIRRSLPAFEALAKEYNL